jgi:small subunit ribosomal protein S1
MTEPDDLELFLSEVDAIAEPQRGDLLKGHVIASDDHGLIVDVGLKRDGMIPSSDLGRLPPQEAELRVGDEIAVMVVEPVDPDGNLIVSVSQARESEDWVEAQRLMAADAIFEAKPKGYNRGGLIVPFGRLRGFVPASHLSDLPRGLDESERAQHLARMVGQELPFKVLEVDPQRRRLVLSERKAVRQWRQEQKAALIETLSEGDVRTGTVTSLREFGAFVDVGGADGLIHISELSWTHVEDPSEILEVGQEIETLVIRLDHDKNRIGLSLKRLQPSPWENITDHMQPGMVLDAVATRMASSGVYVVVEGLVEGLIRADPPAQMPAPGMEIKVRILSIDPERERMDLELVEADELVEEGA